MAPTWIICKNFKQNDNAVYRIYILYFLQSMTNAWI